MKQKQPKSALPAGSKLLITQTTDNPSRLAVETKARWLPIKDSTSLEKYTHLFVTDFTIKMLKNQQREHTLNVPVAAAMIAKFTFALSNFVFETGNAGKPRPYLEAQPVKSSRAKSYIPVRERRGKARLLVYSS